MVDATRTTGLRDFTEGAAHSLLAVRDVDSDVIMTCDGHEGMPHVVDYTDAIGMGKVLGHSRFGGLGRRDSLATTAGGDDISDIVAVAIPWPNQSVGEQMTVVSDSVNDTAAGSGARTLTLHYLTAAGVYTHETLTLNGTTPVNTVATNIRFEQNLTVATLGVFGGKNAGNITLYRTGDATRIYARIVAGNNVSLSTARMVPAGYDFWLKALNVSATSSKPISVRLTATCDHTGVYTEGVFQFEEIVECQDSVATIVFSTPKKIPALSIIKGIAVSTQAGGSVALSYDGWIE